MMRNNESTADYQAVIDSPIPHVARLGIRTHRARARSIDFLTKAVPVFVEKAAEEAVAAINDYFSSRPDGPLLELTPQGTPFQHRVWDALRNIPYGEVRRYGEIATELGSSARAVAGACRANPIPLLIPCHRVVSVNGPGGYMGKTSGNALVIKLWLLQHEGHF